MLKIFKSREQKVEEARADITRTFEEFMKGEGRLPEGFSEPYIRITSFGLVLHDTPFKAYLDTIKADVDRLDDDTGISDWLYLDESVEINAAAAAISDWAKRYKEMYNLLRKKGCVDKKTTVRPPEFRHCGGKIMVVIDDKRRSEGITEESIERCKAEKISFCTVLSDRKLYDLFEQKEKEVTYETFPNYHDETYAFWSLK